MVRRPRQQTEAGPLPATDELQAVLEELGTAGGQVMVFRMVGGAQRYLDTIAPDEFSYDALRERFGGGKYLVRAKRDGKFVAGGTKTVEIDGAPREPRAASSSADESRLDRIERALESLAAQRASPPPAPVDPMQIAAQLGQVAAQNMATMVQLFETMKPAPVRGGGADPIDQLLRVIELRDRLTEASPDGDNGYGAVLKTLAEPLATLLKRATPPESPVGAPPSHGEQPMAPAAIASADIYARLAPYVPQLIALAASGSPAELWADVIHDRDPGVVEQVAREVATRGSQEAFLDGLQERYPELRPRRVWIAQLVASMLEDDAEAPAGD